LLLLLVPVQVGAHEATRPHHFLMTQVEILDSVLYFDVWVERPTQAVTEEFREMFDFDPAAADEQDRAFQEANFQRMYDGIEVLLDGEELALSWEPGPLVNNGRGNGEFFNWAIVAQAPVPETRRELDLRIENSLFEDEHIFMSCYVQLDGGWKVAFDSNQAVLEASGKPARPGSPGVSWTHDPAVRSWELRLRR
jgi:hypothetical protein